MRAQNRDPEMDSDIHLIYVKGVKKKPKVKTVNRYNRKYSKIFP